MRPAAHGGGRDLAPTTHRTYLYARPDGLGQISDLSLPKSEWDPDQFRRVIARSISDHGAIGGGMT